MKFEVYKDKGDTEKKIELRLCHVPGHSAAVSACMDGEHVSYIVTFKKNGAIYFHQGVRERLGFQLDDEGRVKVRAR